MEFQRFRGEEYLRLPDKPGIYKFFDATNKVIYIGKAKNLKKRVASYFNKTDYGNRKTARLVSEIVQIEFIIVSSEFDALLLENNLIKKYQPKFNILLKDDKSFPSICISKEPFPRIYSTRKIDHSKGEYFGPYTSVKAMNAVLDLIRKLYTIRTCKLNLSPQNIKKQKFKVCLEYHIGNCLGPCEALQEESDYLLEVKNAKQILKGKVAIVRKSYKEKMNQAASILQFERAASFKDKIDLLDKFQTRSLVVSQAITQTDVFSMITGEENNLFVNYMKIDNGAIISSETIEIKKKIDENDIDIFRFSIFDLRKKYNSENQLIITNHSIDPWEGIEIVVPQIGDKKKLLELSKKNVLFLKKEKATKPNKIPNEAILTNLMKDLGLKDIPAHIECFDNSNIQGTNPVASMVCFKNGKPSKKDYRKYNIKTVVGPDDFASMKEIVGRRYSRLKKEGMSYPHLIVIDGGKGQLSSACDALKEIDLYGQIPIIGIAKKLEEIYYPEDNLPLHISKKSSSLKLLQHLRDEAHRFAITFHRQKRNKQTIKSSLDDIEGIGDKTKKLLLKEFGSTLRIKHTTTKELINVVGSHKAKKIKEAIKKGNL